MTLRKELGEQTSARVDPHSPTAQPEKALDERVSHVTQQSTTSQEDTFSRRSLGPMFPTDISPADIWNDAVSWHTTGQRPANRSKARAAGKASGSAPFLQGCVLHAPSSAYPQVMPGSLPSTRPEASQDPSYPAWRATRVGSSASASIGGMDISRRNPFSLDNTPLIEIHDGVHVEAPPAIHPQ